MGRRTFLVVAGLAAAAMAASSASATAQTLPRVLPYDNAAGLRLTMETEEAPAGPPAARVALLVKLLEESLGTAEPGAAPSVTQVAGGAFAQVARRFTGDAGFVHLLLASDRSGAVCHIRAKPGPDAQAAVPGAMQRCATALAQPPQPTRDAKVGSALVDLPPGWERQDKPDGILLRRPLPRRDRAGAADGLALIVVTAPKPSGTPFDDAFAAFADGIQTLKGERPWREGKGVTVNGHRIRWEHRCCGKGSTSISGWTVGIASPAGQQFLQLVTADARAGDAKALQAVFEALVRSVRPAATDRAFALTAPGGGLEGLFSRLDTGLRPNPMGGMDFYADQDPMLFDGTGLFSRNLPGAEGMAAACGRSPVGCGTCTLAAPGALVLSEVKDGFGTLEEQRAQVGDKAGSIKVGDRTYNRVPPLPGPLQGTWNSTFAQSGTLATSSTSISSSRTITFTRDGRFSRSGSSGFSSSNTVGNGTTGVSGASQRPGESGTYRLSGYTLILTQPDGRTETLSLFAPDPGTDHLLVINGSNYLKQGVR